MSKTDRKLRSISLILIAVLVFTAVFNVFYGGKIAGLGASNVLAPSTADASSNGIVKTDLNFDSLREQYINQELVQKSIASYDGDRWVIVELEGDTLFDNFEKSTRYSDFASYAASVEGQKVQAGIKADHTAFLKKLERRGIDYQVKYTYTSIANALAIKVNAEAFNAITAMSGVVDAYYVEYYDVPKVEAVTNNANVYTTGIYNTDGIDQKGEGMVVAILDTGLDYTHEAFQTMPTNKDTLGLTKEKLQGIVNASNEYKNSNGANLSAAGKYLMAEGTADDFYYNEKVPFAYDYADDDANVYPSYSSHGTHVAGIVAGKSDYVVSEDETTGKKETFKGVAPEAQLVICKVFTDNLDSEVIGGASTMGILAALNDCAVLGVDAINMSLGTSAGFTEERNTDAQTQFSKSVYGTIEKLGISLVVAASNDYSSGFGGGNGTNLASNPDSGTVGSPSTYSSSLSVASINGRKASYLLGEKDDQVAFITNSSNEFGQEFDFVDLLYDLASKTRGTEVKKGQTLNFKYVPITGAGESIDYGSVASQFDIETAKKQGFDGVIALVKRGKTSFAEKVQMAMSFGAQACIIYNNVSGTIRMSLGEIEDPIPACSISMDAGKILVDALGRNATYGKLRVNSTYLAGPFMSEFSSWGPTPNLELKPEITAHGGEIISAVASGYDRLSGTSMAAPNMAGAISLLRQYLKQAYPRLEGQELNARVNQVLMSTATIARNEEGNPYSPRKQGAGLADIASAIKSEGYITVLGEGGVERDKTKIELYDDPQKKGIYTLEFVINNITNSIQTYNPTTYVMTETMSSDNKTVAEKAYMLNENCSIQYYVGSNNTYEESNGAITVDPHAHLSVKVIIKLNNTAKQYIESNFKNGMYVEGFVSLDNLAQGGVTIGVPYLAFYGSWVDAPLFDYDEYEIAEDDKDTSKDEYDKIKASAAATTIYGRYWNDKYVLPLGTYIYDQADDDVKIYPEREKIAVSKFDDSRGHAIYELYMVYAGLLRGAREMDVVIINDATGEIVYDVTEYNVRKSYANGGSNVVSPIMLEINPGEWGLQNNSTYSVKLQGRLDYEGGEEPERNTFEFPFTVDYEDPELLEYRIRYMPYTENKVTKYRIFMDLDVRDNQFVQLVLPVYKTTRPTGLPDDPETKEVDESLEEVYTDLLEYPIAVSGQKGETSTVSFEITDIYEEYVKSGQLYLEVMDYAFNSAVYNISIGEGEGENAMNDPESVELVPDQLLKKGEMYTDSLGTEYYQYTLTLPPYTMYTFNAVTTPADIDLKTLTWEGSNERAKANGAELFTGAGAGTQGVQLRLTNTTSVASAKKTYAVVNVLIRGQGGGSIPTLESIQLNPALNASGHNTSLNPSGTATPELELNPNQIVQLTWNWTPWYCEKPDVIWKSDNPDVVSVDKDGKITAKERGTAYITVQSVEKDSVRKTIRVKVGREYNIVSYTLRDYYGTDVIEIPSNLNIMYLDEDCFKGRTDIEKVILPTSLTEIPENAFMGCTGLKEIVIPGQCTTIQENAFKNCTSLEKITLGMYVDSQHNFITGANGEKYYGTLTLGRHAFQNCISLKTIQMYDGEYASNKQFVDSQLRLTTLGEGVFEGCTQLTKVDLTNVRVVSKGVFKDCTLLSNVTIGADTVLGNGMFENCTSLQSVNYGASSVPAEVFKGCTNLETVTFANSISSIGANAFKDTKITNVTLPNGNISLVANAFADSPLATLTLSNETLLTFESNSAFANCDDFTAYALAGGVSENYSVKDGVLYSEDGHTLISVPYAKTTFTLPTGITAIKDGALAGVNLTTLDLSLSSITSIGKYAFANNTNITTVTLPRGLTEIPEGLFDGCTALTSVTSGDNFTSVKKIGKNAFRGCTALSGVTMANVTEIGDSAFEESGITSVPGNKIEVIGEMAFAKSKLVNVSLKILTTLKDGAFANIATLKTVELGGIKEFGYGVFIGSTAITSVSFGEGTKVIGDYAFMAEHVNLTRMTVILPTTLTEIGEYAFLNVTGLTSIDLSHVKKVGQMAFACFDAENSSATSSLKNVDLSNLEEIGFGAFANTSITSANLAKAKIVDSFAFNECSNLTTVTFGALERIGEYAFFGARIKSITLPKTFNKRTYTYEWTTYTKDGEFDDEKSREVLTYTPAAFSALLYLEEIKVEEGNEVFFAEDGVLYSKVKNGYVLEQYPANKSDRSYKVKDNTVMISDSAFEYAHEIQTVELPYTVKTIGSHAFFQAKNLSNYVFNSVEAPTLLANQINSLDVIQSNQLTYMLLDRTEGYGETNFYANFLGYAIEANFGKYFNLDYVQAQFPEFMPKKFNLTMTIPLNARGYDGVWELFFSTIKYTADIMPDDTSHKAMEAIDNIRPYLTQIATMTYDQVKEDGEIGLLAKEARIAYNKVVLTEQLGLLTEYRTVLLNVESALRSRKAQLNHAVAIKELVMSKRPDKIRYTEGEKFDPTGMVLTAIYADGSEVALDGGNYTISPETIGRDTKSVTISYRDEVTGEVVSVKILLNVTPLSNGDDDAEDDKDGTSLSGGAIAGIVIAVVAVIAGAVVATLLILKKKKAGAKKSDESVKPEESEAKEDENTDAVEEITEETESAHTSESEEKVEEKSVDDDRTSNQAEEFNDETADVTTADNSEADATETSETTNDNNNNDAIETTVEEIAEENNNDTL